MHIFITGGAGFIGCNTADQFLRQGHTVTVFDNLSRKGTDSNLAWLQSRHDQNLNFVQGDIRDYDSLSIMAGADAVLHLAGQVAVTTSVVNPREDFEINALGTFNVLEALRNHCPTSPLIYASTNKVYGGMEHVGVIEGDETYYYDGLPHGVAETEPLDFHSPYGCSKGTGDQYTLDYARIYGLKTISFRQSCIYGTRQFGVEDQGWVAHFVIATVKNRGISIFGDGKQVRDLLNVDDLVRAYTLGIEKAHEVAGQAFNIGGGPDNTLSIWAQFGSILEEFSGKDIAITHGEWRPGDQRVFVADIRKAEKLLGWTPQIKPIDGIRTLYDWVFANPNLFD